MANDLNAQAENWHLSALYPFDFTFAHCSAYYGVLGACKAAGIDTDTQQTIEALKAYGEGTLPMSVDEMVQRGWCWPLAHVLFVDLEELNKLFPDPGEGGMREVLRCMMMYMAEVYFRMVGARSNWQCWIGNTRLRTRGVEMKQEPERVEELNEEER